MTGAVIGGVTGLISAHNKGYDLWSGQPKQLSPQVNIDTELMESVAPKADTETLIFKEGNEPRLSVPIEKNNKPTQIHHFATDKNKTFTPEMEKIINKYDLELKGNWNKENLPHIGRHPSEYHKWVLDNMRIIDNMPNMNQQKFLL